MSAVPPRIPLALAPTPILKLDRLSRRLGVELYVKRDDLTGLLESGNKVRKLEFLVGEALSLGADTLITCGTLQSNCCRAVSAVATYANVDHPLTTEPENPTRAAVLIITSDRDRSASRLTARYRSVGDAAVWTSSMTSTSQS